MKKWIYSCLITLCLVMASFAIVLTSDYLTRTTNQVTRDAAPNPAYALFMGSAHFSHLKPDTAYCVTAYIKDMNNGEYVFDNKGEPLFGDLIFQTQDMESRFEYVEGIPFTGIYVEVSVPVYIDMETYSQIRNANSEYYCDYTLEKLDE